MEFRDLVLKRRMVRHFSDEPVAPELVQQILDLARHAPSAGFTQGQSFVVHVTILDNAPATEQAALPGQHMAAILEQLAQQHTLDAPQDAAEWERNIR